VTEQEVDLLEFSACLMAQSSACPTRVARSDISDTAFRAGLLLRTLYPSNPGCKIGPQQSGIGSLVCQPADGGKTKVDGRGRVLCLFQGDPVPGHDGFVKRESRLRAVAFDKFADSVIIGPL
jgi:hypothetical protein